MRAPRHLLAFLLATLVLAPAAQARLGEKAEDLRKRFGKPESQPQKNVLVWLIEENSGALVYTVTFGERGVSIAEGLKPFRQAKLTEQTAKNFISEQLSAFPEAGRARELKKGESCVIGGEKFTAGDDEQMIADETHGVLVVWKQRPLPSVLAVTAELVQSTRR